MFWCVCAASCSSRRGRVNNPVCGQCLHFTVKLTNSLCALCPAFAHGVAQHCDSVACSHSATAKDSHVLLKWFNSLHRHRNSNCLLLVAYDVTFGRAVYQMILVIKTQRISCTGWSKKDIALQIVTWSTVERFSVLFLLLESWLNLLQDACNIFHHTFKMSDSWSCKTWWFWGALWQFLCFILFTRTSLWVRRIVRRNAPESTISIVQNQNDFGRGSPPLRGTLCRNLGFVTQTDRWRLFSFIIWTQAKRSVGANITCSFISI